ncbi:MarR family transcriptional regulator [Streptomyces sudanensis]|uniref:MarR family transcriptional regulator n=1 Tax=Streptomyces sudanensis TaxID=436397 RepID=UPI0020CEB540|nr:MarR family transcriptional regulator [Streptomyces sudanensis]MCQ0001715.1 MarR family transcriptional regulator [Streptomyces sudanensis]
MTRTATPTRPALADPDVSDEDLAAQPVGYWSGVVNRAVIRYLRDTMASVDLTQPLWWALNRLVAAGGDGVTREALTGGLVPLADDPDEVPRLPERLLHRGWATEDEAGLLRPTDAAAAAHARGKALVAEARARMHEGVPDEEYAAALRVLRRIARNAEASGAR